jgi:hypothetical protein
MLVLLHNRAGLKSSGSFYIVGFFASCVERNLFLYLVYMRPFSDFLPQQLWISESKTTNPHLFATQRSLATYFRAETYIKSPQLSAPSYPIKLNTRLCCQVVIGLAKRHKSCKNATFLPSFNYSISTRHTTTAAFFDCSLSRLATTRLPMWVAMLLTKHIRPSSNQS